MTRCETSTSTPTCRSRRTRRGGRLFQARRSSLNCNRLKTSDATISTQVRASVFRKHTHTTTNKVIRTTIVAFTVGVRRGQIVRLRRARRRVGVSARTILNTGGRLSRSPRSPSHPFGDTRGIRPVPLRGQAQYQRSLRLRHPSIPLHLRLEPPDLSRLLQDWRAVPVR